MGSSIFRRKDKKPSDQAHLTRRVIGLFSPLGGARVIFTGLIITQEAKYDEL
jgi:hypothetical protein